jgi:hypothetical protein
MSNDRRSGRLPHESLICLSPSASRVGLVVQTVYQPFEGQVHFARIEGLVIREGLGEDRRVDEQPRGRGKNGMSDRAF